MRLLLTLFSLLFLAEVSNAQVPVKGMEKNGISTWKELDSVKITPNPYYAYSMYEKGSSDHKITIRNLPAFSKIKIYTIKGDLIQELQNNHKTETYWNLKNEENIPISNGVYIIHIMSSKGEEKILKWFGVLRWDDHNF
jgi:hypothetical protein